MNVPGLTSARAIHSCAKSNVLNIKTKTSLLFSLICLIIYITKAAIKLSVSIRIWHTLEHVPK